MISISLKRSLEAAKTDKEHTLAKQVIGTGDKITKMR
jgi:hypothetical protein